MIWGQLICPLSTQYCYRHLTLVIHITRLRQSSACLLSVVNGSMFKRRRYIQVGPKQVIPIFFHSYSVNNNIRVYMRERKPWLYRYVRILFCCYNARYSMVQYQKPGWVIILYIYRTVCKMTPNEWISLKRLNSTQLNERLWTQVLKHLNVHIYLFTSVYQVLQSTWFAYWSVADSGQVGRKIMHIKHLGASRTYLNVLWTDKQYQHQQQN